MIGRHSQFLPCFLWLSYNEICLSYYVFKSNNSILCYCFLRIAGYFNCIKSAFQYHLGITISSLLISIQKCIYPTHIWMFLVCQVLCGEFPPFIHFPLKKEKGTVIFIYFRGISWDSENLGELACGGHIDRPKAGIGSSDSSTTVSLLWDDHIGVWKLTGKCNIS